MKPDPVKKAKAYDSDSIETQRFPDNIRNSPAMYVGGTDAHGMFVTFRELLDNGADEHLAGRNNYVVAVIDADGSYWVQDGGAGIPQGIKKVNVHVNGKTVESSMPTMQSVFGELHTSGKFKSDAYRVSMGTHGVGAKGTNATALFFEVFTCFKGKWYSIKFAKGVLKSPVAPCKAPKSQLTGKLLTKGTVIHYKPDPEIFTVKSFPPSMLMEWAELQAYLNPGFRIVLKVKDKVKQYLSEGGPKDYIEAKLKSLKAESEPTLFEFKNELATISIAFSNVDGFMLAGFTNGLANPQGGTHVDSVSNAIYQACIKHKGTKQQFKAADFKDGLLGIVNANLHKAEFSSQDKAKLTDPRMTTAFEAVVFKAAEVFFNKNRALAKRLCDRASKVNELRVKFKASKAVATALNKVKRQGLPPNYAPAHRSVPIKDRVLFIVEGDSAAGGLRQVRMKHQALLPLTGKIMNCFRAKGDRALLSKAILNVLGAIGFDPKLENPLKKLQVGKIICLADGDPDGAHINCLLLTLFSKYLPEIFDEGMVYVADMPEFYSIVKDRIFTGDTLSEVKDKLKKAGIKGDVLHAKGWGEVDAQVLKILAIDSATSRVIKMKPITDEDSSVFNQLMGKVNPIEDSKGENE